jgi:hypothetical protein
MAEIIEKLGDRSQKTGGVSQNTPSATKKRLPANYGVHDIGRWEFTDIDLPAEWEKHLGEIPHPFRMYVSGDPGHGKTEYLMKLSIVMANYYGKVHLNNVEQGKHKGIKQSWVRNNFAEVVPAGKWMYAKKLNVYDDYVAYLSRRNSCKLAMIDSISYWNLTYDQVKELFERFPLKSFIIVGYGAHWNAHKPIRHLCDVKVKVADFMATMSGRFGGFEPYVIYQKGYEQAMRKGKGFNGQMQLL